MSSVTVASLKAEGVELFRQKRYPSAIQKFTAAIELDEPGCDELKVQCYNNRAAAREHSGEPGSKPAILSDLNEAIRLKPDYGKAYVKRMRHYLAVKKYSDALADLFAAKHVGAMPVDGEGPLILGQCLDYLQKERRVRWLLEIREAGGERPVPVKHEKVTRWLDSFGRDDGLLKDVERYAKGELRDEGTYSLALQLLAEKQYDDVDAIIRERKDRLGERAPECWMLAGRMLIYKCSWKKSCECLTNATQLLKHLPDGERKKGLEIAFHVIGIESSQTAEMINDWWRKGVAVSPSTPDLYFHACNRLLAVGARSDAKAVINDPRIGDYISIQQQRLSISVLERADRRVSLAAAQAFEKKLGDHGMPGYPTRMLGTIYYNLGMVDKACALLREAAERVQESTIWNDLGAYTPSKTEREYAIQRSIAIEPFHHSAHLNIISQQIGKVMHTLPTRQESASLLSSIERALSSFDPSRDNEQLLQAFSYHEVIKAKIRAADMVRFVG